MYKMFIDDERFPVGDDFVICRTSDSAIQYMSHNGAPSYISFDHDLGGNDTAMKVVHWMINLDIDSGGSFLPDDFSYEVHSQNPVGRSNILGALSAYFLFRSVASFEDWC
jgi:hypothetical protein